MTPSSIQKFTVLKLQLITILVAVFCLFASAAVNAQPPDQTADEWLPIVIGDNAVVLEVSAKYRMVFSQRGFLYALNNQQINLRNAYIFRSFENDTYISLDIYDGRARASALMYDDIVEKALKKGRIEKYKKHAVRHAFLDPEFLTVIQQYISIDGKVILLTAASRKGETEAMKHSFPP